MLFGGGQAQLVLTGDEILDSGVQVVAQPPGKRNTSIHLLSGGEKALTAISLVFALFQLNPAPFCLLDEVDAPLDDPNTDRFCRMVQEMSRADAVPVHLAQQDHDGDGEPADRHHDARARHFARRRGRHRRGARARHRRRGVTFRSAGRRPADRASRRIAPPVSAGERRLVVERTRAIIAAMRNPPGGYRRTTPRPDNSHAIA